MKKLLSVLLALMMSVSVLTVASVSALAVQSPTAAPATENGPVTEVNGSKNDKDVEYTVEEDLNGNTIVDFKYTGGDNLKSWEDNLNSLGFVEGVDYTRTTNADGTYSIVLISQAAIDAFNNGNLVVNAIVDGNVSTTATSNDSSKSPSTGVATSVIAGSIAVAGAGIAVLSATKKRDAE